VVGQFEDLVARGLLALIEDDPHIEVIRAASPTSGFPPPSPSWIRASRS
jgi:hypothetical protein